MRRLVIVFVALLLAGFAISAYLLAGFTAPAVAQEAPPALVGQVSHVSGQLAFHMPGETEWSAALVNYPVATGGSFWTDPQSRAQFRIGPQTIALAGGAEVDVVKLDEQVMELGLPQGRVNLHVRSLGPGNTAQIDLPRGGVWLLQPGIYDIDAGGPDQPSRIAVFAGSARFVGGGIDRAVPAGSALVVAGTTALTARLEPARPDEFDAWARAHDYREKRLAAPYYVSPEMTGYSELDEYGSWQEAPQYGRIWYPRAVPADWAPYRDGHWVSVAPWGWTWVDAEPWGFAPFHYGRWARIHDRWGWIPGRFEPHPVYAPALVAFIGEPGAGIALPGAPGPAVGWFPLGPDEVYWPTYTRDPTYIRNVNITNVSVTRITRITNVIVNRPGAAPPPQVVRQNFVNRGAATVVPVKAFAGAARIDPKKRLHVAPQVLQRAPVSVRPPHVAPAAARIKPARPVAHPPAANAPVARHPAAAAPAAGAAPPSHPPGRHPALPAGTAATHPPGAPAAAAHRAPPPHVAPPAHAPAAAAHPAPPQVVRPGAPAAAAHRAPPPHVAPPAHAPAAAAHRAPPPHVAPPAHAPAAAAHRAPPPHVAPPAHAPAAAAHRAPPPHVAPPAHAPAAAAHRAPPAERRHPGPTVEHAPPQARRTLPPARHPARAAVPAPHPGPHPAAAAHPAAVAHRPVPPPHPPATHPAAVAHRAPPPRPHPAAAAHREATAHPSPAAHRGPPAKKPEKKPEKKKEERHP